MLSPPTIIKYQVRAEALGQGEPATMGLKETCATLRPKPGKEPRESAAPPTLRSQWALLLLLDRATGEQRANPAS